MTEQDVTYQKDRIAHYDRLNARRAEIRRALAEINRKDTDLPGEAGPFTGNTRESRSVDDLLIDLTKTKGGSKETSMRLADLNIPAYEFGTFLRGQLNAQLAAIEDRIAKL